MKKIVVIGLLITLTLSGCGKVKDYVKDEPKVQPEKVVEQETEDTEMESEMVSSTEAEREEGFSFADVADREFFFSSGAGGWCTVLYIDEDGSFEGNFRDSDMGSTGEGYPNGTLYYCDFKGRFTEPQKVNDYTYRFQIAEISLADEVGKEENKDGIHYIYSDAYGLDDSEYFFMYLPGTPLAELSEEFLRWIGYHNGMEGTTDTELPFYALYNVEQEYGFYDYSQENSDGVSSGNGEANPNGMSFDGEGENSNDTNSDSSEGAENGTGGVSRAKELAEASLRGAKTRVDVLEEKLESGYLSQIEMNQTSYKIYTIWDDQLNYIWKLMKENLPEDQMKDILTKQRAWIKEKEQKVKEAGAECEGGSLQPLLENTEAAELTRERAYELLDYFK